jgi:hypothetical protein
MYDAADAVALDIQAVVSELITNSVRAEARHLTLAIDGHHTRVALAATDDAPGDPVKQEPAPNVDHGRGLLIVDALSARWGVRREAGSKTVWAEVRVGDNAGPTFDGTE